MNKFLLAGDKFMFEIHLRQSGFRNSAFELFTKTKKEYKNLKKQEIYRTASDKVIRDTAFDIAKSQNKYHRSLAVMVYKFFDKTFSGASTSGGAIANALTHLLKTIFGLLILWICS